MSEALDLAKDMLVQMKEQSEYIDTLHKQIEIYEKLVDQYTKLEEVFKKENKMLKAIIDGLTMRR